MHHKKEEEDRISPFRALITQYKHYVSTADNTNMEGSTSNNMASVKAQLEQEEGGFIFNICGEGGRISSDGATVDGNSRIINISNNPQAAALALELFKKKLEDRRK